MKHKKALIGIMLILGITFILTFINPIFIPYNDIHKRWKHFYDLPQNSIDMLFIGSSHSYTSFNPKIFQKVLGIKSFNLSSNSENISQTYFHLVEALKTQNPKMVVLETFKINPEKGAYSPIMRDSNFESMKMSLNKLQALTVWYKKTEYFYALFPIIKYHNNWANYSIQHNIYEEYKKTTNTTDGFDPKAGIMTSETAEKYKKMTPNKSEFVISDYAAEYIEKIVKLCEKKKIQILFVNAPMFKEYLKKIDYNSRYKNTKNIIAGKYGKTYIDFNLLYDDLKLTRLDFNNEFNTYHHLNYKGSEKVSLYLSNWIKNNYKDIKQGDG